MNELTLIFSLSTTTVLIIKSTPIVAPWPGGNTPCVKRRTKHVLPANESTLNYMKFRDKNRFYAGQISNDMKLRVSKPIFCFH